MTDTTQLKKVAKQVRRDCITRIYEAGKGHPGGSLSAVDIFTALYFHKMRIDVDNPKWEDRDRCLLGKGHSSWSFLPLLARRGFYTPSKEKPVPKIDDDILGVPFLKTPGCDMSSGSLGQNLSVAAGMALAGKLDKKDYMVYIVLGDGELQEGQNWEAAMMIANYNLGNVVAIVDKNEAQLCGDCDNIMSLRDIGAKFEAFGWRSVDVDGHDFDELIEALDSIERKVDQQPTVIVAHTVKGKGVDFMEGAGAKWHGASFTKEQYEAAMASLGGDE